MALTGKRCSNHIKFCPSAPSSHHKPHVHWPVESVVKGKSLFASAIAQSFKMFRSTECMTVANKLTSGTGNRVHW